MVNNHIYGQHIGTRVKNIFKGEITKISFSYDYFFTIIILSISAYTFRPPPLKNKKVIFP